MTLVAADMLEVDPTAPGGGLRWDLGRDRDEQGEHMGQGDAAADRRSATSRPPRTGMGSVDNAVAARLGSGLARNGDMQGRPWPEEEMVGSGSVSTTRRLVLAFALALPVVLVATPAQAAAPDPTTGYYVRSTGTASATRWYDYGCAQGQKDALRPGTQNRIVLLDFGTPMLVGGVYGFDLPGGAADEFRSRPEAQPVAVNFAVGYYACTGTDRASIITLAIGTTNAGTQVRDNGYQQGRAFANFVRAITSAVAAK